MRKVDIDHIRAKLHGTLTSHPLPWQESVDLLKDKDGYVMLEYHNISGYASSFITTSPDMVQTLLDYIAELEQALASASSAIAQDAQRDFQRKSQLFIDPLINTLGWVVRAADEGWKYTDHPTETPSLNKCVERSWIMRLVIGNEDPFYVPTELGCEVWEQAKPRQRGTRAMTQRFAVGDTAIVASYADEWEGMVVTIVEVQADGLPFDYWCHCDELQDHAWYDDLDLQALAAPMEDR